MSDMESVLSQLGGMEPVVEPLFIKAQAENRSPIGWLYRLVCIALWGWVRSDNKDPRTPYRPGALSWGEHVQDAGVNATLFMLQLMMLLMDSLERSDVMSSYRCTVSPESNASLYKQICVSVAKIMLGKGSKDDFKNKQNYVVTDQVFSPRFMHDLAYEKEVLRQKKPKKSAKKKQKKAPVPLTQHDRIVKRFNDLGVDLQWFGCVETHTNAPMMPVLNEQDGEQQEEEQEEKLPKPEFKGNPNNMEKIIMTITEIPHENDAHEIMGMMVNFAILDPLINPGLFYSTVERNMKSRNTGRNGNPNEMFRSYEKYMVTAHPVGNRTTLTTYANMVQQLYPNFVVEHYMGQFQRFMTCLEPVSDSPAHIYNLMTPDLAIECLRNAGGDPRILGRASDWVDRKNGILKFPEDVRTWVMPRNSVFWYRPQEISFVNAYFPFVDLSSDFLRALTSGTNMRNFLQGASDETQAQQSRMEKLLSSEMVVLKKAIMNQRSVGYETQNELIYAYHEANLIYSHINEYYPAHHVRETFRTVQELKKQHGPVRWRDFLEEEDEKRIEEYELYSNILNTAQDALTKKFCNIVQLDGHVDSLKISEPLKAMLRWYQGVHEKKLPHMSRPYVSIDPELDAFGNTMLTQLFIYTRYAKILQPLICLLSEGLFSCYDAFMEELSFHLMIHGRYDVGKTYTAIKTLKDFTCIPGTVSEYSLSTKAADTTQKHSYDEIVAMDECPDWFISEAEAKKNPDLVNKEKVKMTRGQLVQKTFVFLDSPTGRKIRWADDVTTDHKKAYVFVTNLPPEDKKALSSRTYRFIMKQSNMTPAEMKGLTDQLAKSDTKVWLHINQFTSAFSKKLAAAGGILPEVEMDLFEEISTRVIHWLKQHNAIGNDNGPRSLEMVKPYLRQLVYKMAIRYTFDFEWSEHYEKKFCLEQLRSIQPFLYVTVSQVWWAWTACASEWVNTDIANVLQAMRQVSGCDWQLDDTPYKIFERDVAGKIKFRTQLDEFHEPDQSHEDRFKVNLNYIVLEGSEDSIAQRVAEKTNPSLTAEQVKGIFKQLSKVEKAPHRGGYALQPKGMLEKWHRYLTEDLDKKCTGHECAKIYLKRNPNTDDFRTEDDIEQLQEGTTLPIIDRSDVSKRRLYFQIGMENHFRQELILEALRHATMCTSFRPGKILLGFTDPENTTRLTVHTMDQSSIDDCCRQMDEASGFVQQRDGRWQAPNPFAVSRTRGIPLNRCSAFTNMDQTIATAVPWAPKPVGDNTWKQKYADGVKPMSVSQEIITDLDEESAIRRHLRCGLPLWEEVRSPAWIARQIGIASLEIDYPHDEIDSRAMLEQKWQSANKATRIVEVNQTVDIMSKMSRRDRQALILQQQQQQRRGIAPAGGAQKRAHIRERSGGVRGLLEEME